jgi:hypothetical protein
MPLPYLSTILAASTWSPDAVDKSALVRVESVWVVELYVVNAAIGVFLLCFVLVSLRLRSGNSVCAELNQAARALSGVEAWVAYVRIKYTTDRLEFNKTSRIF